MMSCVCMLNVHVQTNQQICVFVIVCWLYECTFCADFAQLSSAHLNISRHETESMKHIFGIPNSKCEHFFYLKNIYVLRQWEDSRFQPFQVVSTYLNWICVRPFESLLNWHKYSLVRSSAINFFADLFCLFCCTFVFVRWTEWSTFISIVYQAFLEWNLVVFLSVWISFRIRCEIVAITVLLMHRFVTLTEMFIKPLFSNDIFISERITSFDAFICCV